ncbi:hypothetical protein RirG_085530 [Rhizophagus irregularis DAOM 197198w]|uniref:Uncharacterized protein n=1 Tax=Rhizophagus irregularis (strain DAOM 197198w) TaxID=1432141 RepID=A0A015MV76_RHIIW|nr:hypothetical protein RirG_085530 [Rhizophagus irregularis DAOM 197198w]
MYNSQNITNELLSKGRNSNTLLIYGISQNPYTKDYIIVIQDEYCEKYGEEYMIFMYCWNKKWCKPCQIDNLKKNFINWTSGNEKVDNFIQEFQLKINHYNDIIVEWIPYNQFDNIKEIGKNDLFTIYSAIWKNGQLNYDKNKKEI